MFRNSIVFLV